MSKTDKSTSLLAVRSNAGLDAMPNFWCEVCGKIQPTFFEGAHNIDVSGNFIGGDIVCKKCCFIIATAYTPNVEVRSGPAAKGETK